MKPPCNVRRVLKIRFLVNACFAHQEVYRYKPSYQRKNRVVQRPACQFRQMLSILLPRLVMLQNIISQQILQEIATSTDSSTPCILMVSVGRYSVFPCQLSTKKIHSVYCRFSNVFSLLEYITISCTGFAENRLEKVLKVISSIDKNRFKHLKYFVKEIMPKIESRNILLVFDRKELYRVFTPSFCGVSINSANTPVSPDGLVV